MTGNDDQRTATDGCGGHEPRDGGQPGGPAVVRGRGEQPLKATTAGPPAVRTAARGLARALDVVVERWSLVIIQELLKQPRPYGELIDRLPGIGTSVLADRLRRLERAGVVARQPGTVGGRVCYTLTARGRELQEPLRALRRWGAGFLADPTADGSTQQHFDVSYVGGIQALADGQFQLVVDDRPATLRFAAGRLRQEPGAAPGAELIIRTTSGFLDRWAAGDAGWEDGRASGEVITEGPPEAWPRWLAATGYLLHAEPETTDA